MNGNETTKLPVHINRFIHRELKRDAVEERLYQNEILETTRAKNTLVVLPTALGKTVIAMLLAIEKMEYGTVVFLAPTRPLVQQHFQTFMEKTYLEEELRFITGKYRPSKRATLYRSGKVVFATPQCVYNDLKHGLLTLENASLIIFDEAHRARGNYAYVGIARYYFTHCQNPAVLGLTASPGSSEERITEICKNLGIEAIEFRSDEDKDVKPYIQRIDMEWKKTELPESYIKVRDRLKEMLIKRVKNLQSVGVLSGRKPIYVTRRELVKVNQDLQRRINSGEGGFLYKTKVEATVTLSIMHMIELIETQGPETLKAFIEKSLHRLASEGSKGHRSIMNDPIFVQVKLELKNCHATQNPKIVELKKALGRQFETNSDSRLMIFTQYRDTVKAIIDALKNQPGFKVKRFVGQGNRDGDPGMTQQQQKEILEELRMGKVNIMVATSIAEEGLDIPEVDHVFFYEPVPSEIRYIQRRGRTGRRVAGKVTILIAEDTLDEAYYWSSISKTKKMRKTISHVNSRIAENLKHKTGGMTTLENFQHNKDIQVKKVKEASKIHNAKKELWRPKTIETKGVGRTMGWLLKNLPSNSTLIKDIVERAAEETKSERPTIETALWRLIQQGWLYQPERDKIKKTCL